MNTEEIKKYTADNIMLPIGVPYVSCKQTYGDRILPDARQDKGGKGCTAYVGGAMYIR